MRFNATESFRTASSVKEVLPWGDGIVFTIRWAGNADYRRYLDEHQDESEITKRITELQYKANIEAQARAGKRRGKDRKKFIRELSQEVFAALVRECDMSGSLEGVSNEGVACCLVSHVEGLVDLDTGDPVTWSKESGLELLSITDPIPEDVLVSDEWGDEDFEVDAGTQFGLAVKLWIIWVANRAARFREAQVEAAAKN